MKLIDANSSGKQQSEKETSALIPNDFTTKSNETLNVLVQN